MKCKIFVGLWYEVQDMFNQWAKGKALTREVIIHTLPNLSKLAVVDAEIIIVVYHPDDPFWDKTETQPIPTIQPKTTPSTRMEREVTAQ